MQKMAIAKRGEKGFTLMEMLIVIAIIAVLVAIAIPIFNSQTTAAKQAVDQANCRSAKSLCSAYVMSDCDGDFSKMTPAEWSSYAESMGIPKNGKVDPASELTATISEQGIEFTYGGSSHVPWSSSSVPDLMGDVTNALSSLIGNGASASNIQHSTYASTKYAYSDLGFNSGYTSIASQNLKSYLKAQGMTDAQIKTLSSSECYVFYNESGSSVSGISGYCYTDPSDSTKMIVVSNGTSKAIDKISHQTAGYIGYYASQL